MNFSRPHTLTFLCAMSIALSACQAETLMQTAHNVLQTSAYGNFSDTNKQSISYQKIPLSSLTQSEAGKGLKEALKISTDRVVSNLGAQNGFNLNPKIHIPLPRELKKVDSALTTIGMGHMMDDLELRMNRAAEAATPKAKALFLSAIQNMTFTDAKNILTGSDDAATQYLRRATGSSLRAEMNPIVTKAMDSTGVIHAYNNIMGQYRNIPFVPDIRSGLNDYVLDKAMDGIFYYIAQEERAIRENPAKRTTELLARVFSAR